MIINGFNILSISISQTGKIIAQTGYNLDAVVRTNNAELSFQQGFISIPIKAEPNTNNAPTYLAYKGVDREYILAVMDGRGKDNRVKNLSEGEVLIYGAGNDGKSQGYITLKTDGSINFYTTNDNTSSGKPLSVSLTKDGLKFTSDTMELNIDANGNVLNVGKSAQEPLITRTEFNAFVSKYNTDMATLNAHTHAIVNGAAAKSAELTTIGSKSNAQGTNSIKVKD